MLNNQQTAAVERKWWILAKVQRNVWFIYIWCAKTSKQQQVAATRHRIEVERYKNCHTMKNMCINKHFRIRCFFGDFLFRFFFAPEDIIIGVTKNIRFACWFLFFFVCHFLNQFVINWNSVNGLLQGSCNVNERKRQW